MTLLVPHDDPAVVVCDLCGDRRYLDSISFQDAVAEVKDLGWRIRREIVRLPKDGWDGLTRKTREERWCHYCPDCNPPPLAQPQLPVRELRDSRPYKLGREAAARGDPREPNPMQGDTGRERWYLGYDEYHAGEPG